MSHILNIDRYWYKANDLVSLDGSGYLQVNSFFVNDKLFKFSQLSKFRCAILLGESGSGKSETIKYELKRLTEENNDNSVLVFINLNEYSDENRLINDVFNSPQIEDWKKSDYAITLILDSYDECLIEIPKLNNIFIRHIENLKAHIDRFNIRIVCRSGYWKEKIDKYLRELYTLENYCVFNIAPLQQSDVKLFLDEHIASDAEAFFNELESKKLQPFALQPMSLITLLNHYKTKGFLSANQDILYYESCRNLCIENNEDRISKTTLSSEKKLAIASRIAAIMTFCNKSKIDLNTNFDAKILSISDVQEGIELYNGTRFDFNYHDVKDVITNTSLFSYNNIGLYSFFHQSHQEYLAARYLIQHQVTLEQIKSLITVANDKDGRVVGHLSGTASWLCSLSSDYINEFIQKDPLNILSGDIDHMSDENKHKLFQTLLDKLNTLEITDFNYKLRDSYHKLKHPNIIKQLKPCLINKDNQYNPMVRRFAIDVCERCELGELSNELYKIFTNSSEEDNIKIEAISALSKIANITYRKKLKKFALDTSPTNDEIKGHALNATVPSIVSIKEVFETLTPPLDESFLGMYKCFVNYKLSEYITSENIDSAITWYKKHGIGRRTDHMDEFSELKNNILLFSWREYKDLPPIQKHEFAMLIFEIIKNYASIVPKLKNKDIFKNEYYSIPIGCRRGVLMDIVKSVPSEDITTVIYNQSLIVGELDLMFVINQFRLDENINCRESLARILTTFKYDSSDVNNTIINLYLDEKYHDILKPYIGHNFDPIELKSELAQQLRQAYIYQQKQEQKAAALHKNNVVAKIDIIKKIEATLDLCETSQNTQHLVDVFYYMTFDIESSRYKYETIFHTEIYSYELWEELNEEHKLRIIKISKDYINNNDDKNEKWKETNNINYVAITGYKCLVLLFRYDKNYVKTLSPDVWEKWMHILILCPRTDYVNEDNTYQEVLKIAYTENPAYFINTLKTKIKIEEDRDVSVYSIFDRISEFVDNVLLKELFDFIQCNTIKDESVSYIMGFLLIHRYEPVYEYLESILTGGNYELSVIAGRKILQYNKHTDTSNLFVKLANDHKFTEDVFLSRMLYYDAKLIEGLSPDKIGQLYIILCTAFPKSEDPTFEGVHYVGPREEVGIFRDKLLSILTNAGESKVITAIKDRLPNDSALNFALINAKDVSRQLSWSPPSVVQFLDLISDTRVRIVTKPDDLLDLIIDSLVRLENKLQKDNPLSFVLWNKNEGVNKPKSEEEFSDYIKNHLESDIHKYGAIVNREPQFRRPNSIKGGRKGEKIDILVSLVAENGDDIAVVIEVKGSWNTGIITSMEKQLHDRYLENEATKHGLYLVCWCECEAKDRNVKNAIKVDDIDAARDLFLKQAETLSQKGKTVKSFVLDCGFKN